MMKLKSLIGIFVLASFSVFAQTDIRIDIVAKSGILCNSVSDGLTAAPARWMKERQDERLVVTANSEKEWKKYSFTFTPKGDCEIAFILMGNRKDKEVCFDDIVMKGCELKNGDFEKLNSKSLPENWIASGTLVSEGAATGKYCAKTNHDKRFEQKIKVKGGTPIKVDFMAKSAE